MKGKTAKITKHSSSGGPSPAQGKSQDRDDRFRCARNRGKIQGRATAGSLGCSSGGRRTTIDPQSIESENKARG